MNHLLVLLAFLVTSVSGFSSIKLSRAHMKGQRVSPMAQMYTLPTQEEAAEALTMFLAKAHEEKLRAVRELEHKYRAEIESLKAKVAEYEQGGARPWASSQNSFEFPATNKMMAEKISAYKTFLSEYVVKTQLEKFHAVKKAEAKVAAKYEAILEEMRKKQ